MIKLQSRLATAGDYLGVAQLVARYLGVVEAARSSRVTQTKYSRMDLVRSAILIFSSGSLDL